MESHPHARDRTSLGANPVPHQPFRGPNPDIRLHLPCPPPLPCHPPLPPSVCSVYLPFVAQYLTSVPSKTGNSSAPRQVVIARGRLAIGLVAIVAALSATTLVHFGGDRDDAQSRLLEEVPGRYGGGGDMLTDHYNKELRQSKSHPPP